MKKYLLLFIVPICVVSNAQQQYSYAFEKLAITDTIYNNDAIKILKDSSEYSSPEYFFAGRHFEGEADVTIYCLIKKKNDYWISYAVPYEYGPNTATSLIGPSGSKHYFLASSYYNHLSQGAGYGNENTISKLIVIDIIHDTYIQLDSYAADQYWKFRGDSDELEINEKETMISKYIFEDNNLRMLPVCYGNEGIKDCINPGGLYEFTDDRLKKIKNYNLKTMGLESISYVGDIAIGMTLEEIRLLYPNANFIGSDNIYGTCADAQTGFEFWNDNKLLGFVLTRPVNDITADKVEGETLFYNEKVCQFIVLSPAFSFDKININSTVAEVLKLYPNANIRLDTLTEWEHIYIQELNIELVLKTDDSNRMGIYKDETFVKLKNKKAKIDYIVVSG